MSADQSAVYAGTNVLRNKYDIRDASKLRQAEYRAAAYREIQLREQPVKGAFNFDRLRGIHQTLFQDVYTWAGQPRDNDFTKRNQKTDMFNMFTPSIILDVEAKELDKLLADRKDLKGLTKGEFVTAIAEVHTKMNSIHPFREGNGRSTKVFLTQLAEAAGFKLDLSKIDKEQWDLASHRALAQFDPNDKTKRIPADLTEIRKVFDAALTPSLAHAFAVEQREQAVKLHPALEQVYARLDAIEQFAAKLPERGGQRLVDVERDRIAEKLASGTIPPLTPYLVGRFSPSHERALSTQHTAAVKPAVAAQDQVAVQTVRSRGARM
jgi:cell filamentation protein